MLGIQARELSHAALLARLLDSKASHGMGAEALRRFLLLAARDAPEGVLDPGDIDHVDVALGPRPGTPGDTKVNCQPRVPRVLLSRGVRSYARWVAALRGHEAVGHRDVAVPKEDLLQVVDDAGAPPLERAAAAVALGSELGAGERARVSRAARTTAAPKLRVVLDAASDLDDEALAAQLEELERTSDTKRARRR